MPKEVKAAGLAVLLEGTPTLATAAYSASRLLFTSTKLLGASGEHAVRGNGAYGQINSIAIIDKDDQGAGMTLFFYSGDVTAGTRDTAPAISDADAAKSLGHVTITSSDYYDMGGSKEAFIKPSDFAPIIKGDASGDIYAVGMNDDDTPTHTANGLTIRVGVVQA